MLNFDTAQLTVNYLEYNLKYTPKNTKWFDTVIRLSDGIYMEQIFTQKELGEGGFFSATIGTEKVNVESEISSRLENYYWKRLAAMMANDVYKP